MATPFGAVQHLYFSCQPAGTAPAAGWTNTDCPAAESDGRRNVIWIRVEMTFTPITPILGQTWTLTMSGSATMVVN